MFVFIQIAFSHNFLNKNFLLDNMYKNYSATNEWFD